MAVAGLLLQIDTEKAILSPHIESPVAERHGTPELQVEVLPEIALEDVGFGEELEALGAGLNEPENALLPLSIS